MSTLHPSGCSTEILCDFPSLLGLLLKEKKLSLVSSANENKLLRVMRPNQEGQVLHPLCIILCKHTESGHFIRFSPLYGTYISLSAYDFIHFSYLMTYSQRLWFFMAKVPRKLCCLWKISKMSDINNTKHICGLSLIF